VCRAAVSFAVGEGLKMRLRVLEESP
jgi:hypothetical protein